MAEGWRPKAKALSPEEVLEKAKKDLAPFWIHSSPLLAPVPGANGTFTLFPFASDFEDKIWLVGLIDLCSYSGQRTLTFLREMHERYSPFSLQILALFWSSDRGVMDAAFLERSTKALGTAFPGVLDPDLMLARAFGFSGDKNLVVHSKRRTLAQSAVKATLDFEQALQASLRLEDPGLSLPIAMEDADLPPFETATLHLPASEDLLDAQGIWKKEADRWSTQDPLATLALKCQDSRFGIVARALSETAAVARVLVEVGGKWVREDCFDEKMILDEEGRTLTRLEGPMLYPLLKGVKDHQAVVTLKFTEADRVPVEIFSFRFAK